MKAGNKDVKSAEAVEAAFDAFFNAYAVVQTIAEAAVVQAARVHGYRFHELRDEALGKPGKLDPPNFASVDELVRDAGHKPSTRCVTNSASVLSSIQLAI